PVRSAAPGRDALACAAGRVEEAEEDGPPLAERKVEEEGGRRFIPRGGPALDGRHPERLDLDEIPRAPFHERAGGLLDVAVAHAREEGFRAAEVEEERLAVRPDPPRVLARAGPEREVGDFQIGEELLEEDPVSVAEPLVESVVVGEDGQFG